MISQISFRWGWSKGLMWKNIVGRLLNVNFFYYYFIFITILKTFVYEKKRKFK